MTSRLIGYLLIVLGIIIAVGALYLGGRKPIPLVFSPTQMLGDTWDRFKENYIDSSGRTLDKQRENITTSEGESYTMLRAVWMGDKQTFDAAWRWTHANLLRSDNLFAWLYGQRADGSWGVLTEQGGNNTASDADIDIAMALTFGYARWQDPAYLNSARAIIQSIWQEEVFATADGTLYLAANNTEKSQPGNSILINPSYYSPAAFRIFAQVDTAHPWQQLVDDSYKLLNKSIDAPLGSSTVGLPPDWLRVNKQTGELLPPGGSLTTNFGFDAIRVPWRVALDYQWNADPRALELLKKMAYLSSEAQSNNPLALYQHDGALLQPESPALYGATLGYFMYADPGAAKRIYEQKIQYLYNPDSNSWSQPLSYYDDNWAWFGIGLYNKLLPNFASSLLPAMLR